MNIKPKKLQEGDTIGTFTASNPITDEVNVWLQNGIKKLESLGFKVVTSKNIFKKSYYTAGTPEERASDFMELIENEEVNMIMSAMGGENAHQILPFIDFNKVKNNPKIIMGHSDPTVLLNPITKKTNLITFYGHHVCSFDPNWPWFSDDYDLKYFRKILMNSEIPGLIEQSTEREIWKEGVAEGEFVGGCLTDFRKLIGTPLEPEFKNKILILEQIGEPPQEINVVITHLKQAGVFDKINGLLLGKFYECVDKKREDWDKSLKQLFLDELKEYDFPILKTEDFGHFSHMFPVPIGGRGRVDATNKKIEILENVVV